MPRKPTKKTPTAREEEEFNYKNFPALAGYIDRIGAEQLNFRRFMVKDYKGAYYTERALIRIAADGAITCSNKEYAPTKDEADEIARELSKASFPRAILATKASLEALREFTDPSASLFEFHSRKEPGIIFVQERVTFKDGRKAFLPWTFFSDGQWRRMEPEGPLPFWKPHGRKASKKLNRIMVHEGAKAAAFVDALVNDPALADTLAAHPWGRELEEYEHWGLIGGALAPHRSDYKELAAEKPLETVYICDNDWPGKAALQEVSRSYGGSLKGVFFDARWPGSWDMADPMPANLFAQAGRYIGPSLAELMKPATSATELVAMPHSKKNVAVIRRAFREEWLHCVTPEVFVHKDWPNRLLTQPEFNSFVAPYSDVDDTARLLKKDDASKSAVLKYNPDRKPGIYGSGDAGRFINTHSPSLIKPERGDTKPWEDFLTHLVPDENDRHELKRWCATLIARPEVRMLYGVLLISEAQGVGKGTLGEKVLAPLVGETNVSYPNEKEIVESAFNYWLAHKRLAVVHEIYQGHSSKAYNNLKSIITDRYITVSKKYQANYEIENWIHVFACSNSRRAIQLSDDDRRWFVPKVTEIKKDDAYWTAFNRWLGDAGGLNIIRWWADEFLKKVKPVSRGDVAPGSALKSEIVEEGMSPGQLMAAQFLDLIRSEAAEKGEPLLVADTDIVAMIRDRLYEGRFSDRLEKPATIRKIAKARGWFVGEKRAFIRGWGTSEVGPRLLCTVEKDAFTPPGELFLAGRKLFPVVEKARNYNGL